MQKAYEERRANEAGRTFCDYNISWHGLFLYLFFFFRRLTPTETVFGAILAPVSADCLRCKSVRTERVSLCVLYEHLYNKGAKVNYGGVHKKLYAISNKKLYKTAFRWLEQSEIVQKHPATVKSK